jgi:hypothetical protein
MCEDYDRRALEIERGRMPPDVVGGYMIMNAAIDAAIASCCEEGIRTEIRHDLAERRGETYTQIYYLSPRTYKLRKKACKLAIAKALHLL